MAEPPGKPHDGLTRPDLAALLEDPVIEAIAIKVAGILNGYSADRNGDQARLVSASKIAAMFDVKASWVYDNAKRLGVVKLGDGPKPRLRFDPEHVRRVLAADQPTSRRPKAERRRSRWIDERDLIPIKRS
jgi:hypothetical protein